MLIPKLGYVIVKGEAMVNHYNKDKDHKLYTSCHLNMFSILTFDSIFDIDIIIFSLLLVVFKSLTYFDSFAKIISLYSIHT